MFEWIVSSHHNILFSSQPWGCYVNIFKKEYTFQINYYYQNDLRLYNVK